MSFKLADFEQRTNFLIKDAAGRLLAFDLAQGQIANASIDMAIMQAAKHYSGDRPRQLVQDYAGAGSFDLPLPAAWDDGFSTVLPQALDGIEYPFTSTSPDNLTLEDDGWVIYLSPAGKVLRLFNAVPQVGETVRVHYTALHRIPTGPTGFTFTAVAVSGATAVYSYSAATGPTPVPGMLVAISGFTNSGNNVTGMILAVTGASITLGLTTQANESHSGAGTVSAGTTIPDADFDAVGALCGELALKQLAILMIQTGDPTLGADVVDYRSKSGQYLKAAEALHLEYIRLMGKEGNEVVAASAQQQMTENLSVGLDRLTHPRRSRR